MRKIEEIEEDIHDLEEQLYHLRYELKEAKDKGDN